MPKLYTSDVLSGFSNKFFTHLVTSYPLTANLLHYVVMMLPDSTIKKAPYDASCLSLKFVLSKTTEGAVIKQLLRWGVNVNDEDVMAATETLADTQVRYLEKSEESTVKSSVIILMT